MENFKHIYGSNLPQIFFSKMGHEKNFFSFVTPFYLVKRGLKKTMTEMPEIASDGLKMKFGHKEFDLRTENDKVWTFRGRFRGQ